MTVLSAMWKNEMGNKDCYQDWPSLFLMSYFLSLLLLHFAAVVALFSFAATQNAKKNILICYKEKHITFTESFTTFTLISLHLLSGW
jgi:hypothetical protein